MDFRRHARFFVALLAGLTVGAASWRLEMPVRILLAGDTFFLVYLLLTGAFLAEATALHLRKRAAAAADEGLALIVLVTGATVALSIGAIFLLLRQTDNPGAIRSLLAAASVPLGWLTLHTLVAFHYANLFYAPTHGGEAGGLEFPGVKEPGPWDFLYFSFVIGMTAQVSDVAVRTTPMRRAVLAHGVASFFYNAVILALAVNAAIATAR